MVATKNMIEYASGISRQLNISEPDYSDFIKTHEFISEHKDEYIDSLKNERTILNLGNLYGEFDKPFTDDFKFAIQHIGGMQGVYVFWNNDEIVYIGKSVDLQSRVFSSLKERIRESRITDVGFIFIEREADMHILEVVLITEYNPRLNKDCCCNDTSKYYKSVCNIDDMQKIKIFKDGDK